MTRIATAGVSVNFGGPPVVVDVELTVPSGRWVGLIGPNGAGKSSLLRALAGLIPYDGRISYGENELRSMPRRAVARTVAFVPQNPFTPDGMLVGDYVLMGRTPYISYIGKESASDIGIASEVLQRLDLDELATRALGSLSGGELQRAVLARALAQQAPVLLLDEPTSALDVGHQQQVLELVDALRLSDELTVVSAMHDLTLAGQFADELVLLDRGRAVATGPPDAVLDERTIRSHYGASVQVVRGPDGQIVVVPVRDGRSRPRAVSG